MLKLTTLVRDNENAKSMMTAVGFEPTQLALVELESTPLDHSGKVSMLMICDSSAMRFVAHKTIALTTELTPRGLDSRSPLSLAVLLVFLVFMVFFVFGVRVGAGGLGDGLLSR